MTSKLQEGIYYRSQADIGNSFCILSLRARNTSKISEIGYSLLNICKHLDHLKKGITTDLEIAPKHRKIGNLTTLVAYSSSIFGKSGSQKKMPSGFTNFPNFRDPEPAGGGPIIDGASISYSEETFDNHLLGDHVIFQFIADSDFYTSRAGVEVWKALHKLKKNKGIDPMHITGLYSGFQRADRRNWLGFHDGVSNLKSYERLRVISIDSKNLKSEDQWTIFGTYLAFMRISINLEKWEDIEIPKQELLIGREKITGCPLTGVDKNGNPIKDHRCPVRGTFEVIERGNERFREHPEFERGNKETILQHSHIARTRPMDKVPTWDKNSSRIYRQGYEFLVPSIKHPGFTTGLNFVSFQNTPERLQRSLTYQQTRHQKSLGTPPLPSLDQYMSVLVAGLFFVPPLVQDEPFPGSRIFFKERELRDPNIGQ
jgi:deferrochelatase/peroxidase EfeB